MCRQLLVLGDTAAVGGLLVEGEEGHDGDNNFNAVATLGLQLCFNLLVVGNDQLKFRLATGGCDACPWVRRECLRGNIPNGVLEDNVGLVIVHGEALHGISVCNVPVGTACYVRGYLVQRLGNIQRGFTDTTTLLDPDR